MVRDVFPLNGGGGESEIAKLIGDGGHGRDHQKQTLLLRIDQPGKQRGGPKPQHEFSPARGEDVAESAHVIALQVFAGLSGAGELLELVGSIHKGKGLDRVSAYNRIKRTRVDLTGRRALEGKGSEEQLSDVGHGR